MRGEREGTPTRMGKRTRAKLARIERSKGNRGRNEATPKQSANETKARPTSNSVCSWKVGVARAVASRSNQSSGEPMDTARTNQPNQPRWQRFLTVTTRYVQSVSKNISELPVPLPLPSSPPFALSFLSVSSIYPEKIRE